MDKLLVSVVIENQTADLSSESHVMRNLEEALRQVKALPAPGGEVIMVSGKPFDTAVPEGVRCVVLPGKSYYVLKNAGMGEARGEVVIFTDADCRLGEGYVERVIERFRKDDAVSCLAGRSYYDGRGFLCRMNTALSFGYLHDPKANFPAPYGVVAHNVAVRAADAPKAPFGDYLGRVTGDAWLTEWYRARGRGPLLARDLVVYHEDPSYSVTLRMDRQLREVLWSATGLDDLRPWKVSAWRALGKACLSPLWRGRKLVRYGRHVGMNPVSIALSVPMLVLYGVADVAAVLTMMLVPSVGERYLRYQNG